MTLEMVERQAEAERLRIQDIKDKMRVLELMEDTLSAAGVYTFLRLDNNGELVIIKFLASDKPDKVVNVHMDNPMAMLVDIFRQAGTDLLAEA